MAFGFSRSPWQPGAASPSVIPWQAQTQSPWRMDRTLPSMMQPGAELPSLYRPPEITTATPAPAQQTPMQIAFGGIPMPMPIPMPIPMPMQAQESRQQMDFVNFDGRLMPSAQAYGGAYAPMQHVGGATTYGPYVDTGLGFGSFY